MVDCIYISAILKANAVMAECLLSNTRLLTERIIAFLEQNVSVFNKTGLERPG
jgi:hypothetical protein